MLLLLATSLICGSEVVEVIDNSGLVRLNSTTVSQSARVQGTLIASHAQIHNLYVLGEANLTSTTLDGSVTIVGYLQAHKSHFPPLTLIAQKAVLVGCHMQGITVQPSDGFKGKQILELKQKTIVDGPITFTSGKGEIHLYRGSKINGTVTGATILKKSS